MGQHSSAEQGPFYRSVVIWFLPWVVVAAIILFALWLIIKSFAGGPGATSSTGHDSSRPGGGGVALTPSPKKSAPAASSTPSPSPSPKKPVKPKPSPKPTPVKLITSGITVQVLNPTSSATASQAMADRLAQLGYDVISVQPALGHYPRTTVYWATGRYRKAAEALAAKFGWRSGPKPANLSDAVSIHVVIGADEI